MRELPRPLVASILSFSVLIFPACGGSAPAPTNPEPAPAAAASGEGAPSAGPKATAEKPPKRTEAAAEQQPESIVQLSFEPLVMGIRPGGTLLLAAHFRIAQGYRISWKASGEVGQPTTVTFSAPPGFDVGPVQFPAPVRFTVPGGYTGLGYENETAIFVEVKAPGALRRDAVSRFDLDATWVACRRICATEHTAAYVELATTYGDARARDVETSVAPYRDRIPKPLASLTDSDASWDTSGHSAVLTVKLPGATPKEFFSDGTADPKPTKTTMSDGELRFLFDQAAKAGDRPLRGVVVASIDGKEAYYDVEAPLAGVDEAAHEPEKTPKSAKSTKPAKPAKAKKKSR